MLIIWLQGIWLPQHGYSFSQTPLWAGIYDGPADARLPDRRPGGRWLSDKHGARLFATTGLIVSGAAFLLLETLPIDFSYVWFALLIFLFAVGMGLFFSPNQAGVMNSLPPEQRGAGAGMLNTFQNSATVLSMGLFFTIVTLGLAARLPSHLYKGLTRPAFRRRPPTPWPASRRSEVFSHSGYNPIKELLGPTGVLAKLSPKQAALHHRAVLLPAPDRGAVRERPAPGVHLRRHCDTDRDHRLGTARQEVRAYAGGGGSTGRLRHRRDGEPAANAELAKGGMTGMADAVGEPAER